MPSKAQKQLVSRAGWAALRGRQRRQKPSWLLSRGVPARWLGGRRSLHRKQSWERALRRGRDVDIVQKRVQTFARPEVGVEVEKSGMLSKRVQFQHEGVSLLAAPSLQHLRCTPLVIVNVTAGLPVEHAGERQQTSNGGDGGVHPKRLEHARAGDVVVGPHAVDAQHHPPRVGFGRGPQRPPTASEPARVLSAYWNGGACCLKRTQPQTEPRGGEKR